MRYTWNISHIHSFQVSHLHKKMWVLLSHSLSTCKQCNQCTLYKNDTHEERKNRVGRHRYHWEEVIRCQCLILSDHGLKEMAYMENVIFNTKFVYFDIVDITKKFLFNRVIKTPLKPWCTYSNFQCSTWKAFVGWHGSVSFPN